MTREEAIEAFEAAFAHREFAALDSALTPDVVLKPPTYWKDWVGAPRVARLVRHAAASIDRLVYVRRFVEGAHAALQFEAGIGPYAFTGMDILTLAPDGRIAAIEIVARPPKAIALLSERMGAAIAGDPAFAR